MVYRSLIVVLAAFALATPLAAQQRGTIEFGGFASAAQFDNALSRNSRGSRARAAAGSARSSRPGGRSNSRTRKCAPPAQTVCAT